MKASDFDITEEIKQIKSISQDIKTTMLAIKISSSGEGVQRGKHAQTAILSSQKRLIKIREDLEHIQNTLKMYSGVVTKPQLIEKPVEVKTNGT